MPELAGLSSDDAQAELAVKSGKVTPAQIADARELVKRMRELGVERDLLGALVERKVLSQAEADDLRALASERARAGAKARPGVLEPGSGAKTKGSESTDVIPVLKPVAEPKVNQVAEAETVEEAEEVAPAGPARQASPAGPGARASASEEPRARTGEAPASERGEVRCFYHPDRTAIASCSHCGRPICKGCAVRTGGNFYCGQACVAGARAAAEAQRRLRTQQLEKSIRLGRYLALGAFAAVVVALGWLAKYIIDDYRFAFAIQRAEARGATPAEAVEAYRRAVQLRPGRADARLKLGRALLAAGEAGAAVSELEKALALEPLNADALSALAEAHLARGNHREAADALTKLRDAKAANSETERTLGMLYLEQLTMPEQAVEAFRRSMALSTESRELRYRIARALIDLGKLKEAKEELDRAVAPIRPDETGPAAAREKAFLADGGKRAWVYEALAQIAEKENDPVAALAYLARAQQSGPGQLEIVKKRVKLLADAGRQAEALKAAEESRDALSGNAEYLDLLSRLQEAAGARAEMLRTLRELYAIAPRHGDALQRLISAELDVGDAKRALALLNTLPREKAASPEFADAWAEVVRVELSSGNVEGAEEILKGLGEFAERHPKFVFHWSDLLHRRGRDKEALERAELAIRHSPNDPLPYLVAGSVLRATGRLREALDRISAAAKLGGGALADLERGLVYWEAGFTDQAKRSLLAAGSDPKLPRHRKALADLYVKRLQGPGLVPSVSSPVETLVQEALKYRSTDPGNVLWQIHLASAGLTRAFSLMSGTVGLEPVGDELGALKRVAYQAADIDKPNAFLEIRAECDRAVKACAHAAKTLAPEAIRPKIDKILAEYATQASAGTHVGQAAAAARAQVMIVAAWLSSHPRRSELLLQVDMALARMNSRLATSPGELQTIICADAALTEMLAAAVAAGPNGFMFRDAVRGVLAELAAQDRASAEPLAQLRSTRASAFGMARILSHQFLEAGQVPVVMKEGKP